MRLDVSYSLISFFKNIFSSKNSFDIDKKIELPYRRMGGASGVLFLANSEPKVKFCMELCPETGTLYFFGLNIFVVNYSNKLFCFKHCYEQGFHWEVSDTYRFKDRIAKCDFDQQNKVWIAAESVQIIAEELRYLF